MARIQKRLIPFSPIELIKTVETQESMLEKGKKLDLSYLDAKIDRIYRSQGSNDSEEIQLEQKLPELNPLENE
ncbi:MAG: hypothetical protein ACTSRK_10700 [Promethearchaeota archaeon]